MSNESPPKILIDTADFARGPYLLRCPNCHKLLLPEHDVVILGSNVAGAQDLHTFHRKCFEEFFPGGLT
jgi:hypothetical protein